MAYSRYGNFGYIYDNLRVLVPGAVEVNKIMQGSQISRVKENYKISDNIYQLGWSSLAVLDNRGGKFQITELHDLKNNKQFKDLEGNFETVVTRGVNTCTYVHVNSGNFHLIAHLDENNLARGLELIKNLTQPKPKFNLEISRLNLEANEETTFAEELLSLPNLDWAKQFYRGGLKAKSFYSHIEIGVDAATGKTYGDTIEREQLNHLEIPLFSDFNALPVDPKTEVKREEED